MENKEIVERLEEMADGLETRDRIYRIERDPEALRAAAEIVRNHAKNAEGINEI